MRIVGVGGRGSACDGLRLLGMLIRKWCGVDGEQR